MRGSDSTETGTTTLPAGYIKVTSQLNSSCFWGQRLWDFSGIPIDTEHLTISGASLVAQMVLQGSQVYGTQYAELSFAPHHLNQASHTEVTVSIHGHVDAYSNLELAAQWKVSFVLVTVGFQWLISSVTGAHMLATLIQNAFNPSLREMCYPPLL